MKSVLFGITANPPHSGHAHAINYLLNLNFEKIFINLSYSHPFAKPGIISYEHRLEMLKIFLNNFDKNIVSLVEWDRKFFLENDKTPYTVDLLDWLKNNNFDISGLSLAFGEDNLKSLTWQKFKDYKRLETFNIVSIPDTLLHSTDLRSLISRIPTEKEIINQINTNIFPEVLDYILHNQIYFYNNNKNLVLSAK